MVLLAQHSRDIVVAYMHRDTVRIFRRIPVPRYLTEFYHLVSWNNGSDVGMMGYLTEVKSKSGILQNRDHTFQTLVTL
jgi:hypothetical protein